MEKQYQVATGYGIVGVVIENGKKKLDTGNCKFNSVMDMLGFLDDTTLTTQIFGY